MSVLLIDDDDDFRDTVSMVLEGEGVSIVSATCGEEALDLLHAGLRPSLILMDLMMPGMNGWVLRSRLAEDPALATIPIAVLSGDHQALRVHPPEGVRCLQKPVSLATLLDVVRSASL